MRRRLGLVLLVCIAVTWNAALAAAPVADTPRLAAMTYLAGALICHQRPERSFYRNGAQYPVCARCLGVYAGGAIGILGYVMLAGIGRAPRTRAMRVLRSTAVPRVLLIAALPTLVTVASAWAGLWDGSNLLRAALAIPLGVSLAAVIAAVAAGDLR